MTTPLDKTLKRELLIDGRAYTLTLVPQGLSLTLKGRRKGIELVWRDLVSGEAALAVALNASLGRLTQQEPRDARDAQPSRAAATAKAAAKPTAHARSQAPRPKGAKRDKRQRSS